MNGAENAGDYALAASYLVVMGFAVYWVAVTVSWPTMLALGGVAAGIILLRSLLRRRL
jgi:hypothetical protein